MTVDLEEFSIYRQPAYTNKNDKKMEKTLSNELVSLHKIIPKGKDIWFFDGIISYGGTKANVQGVPFDVYSIGGYEDKTLGTVGSAIWIQSMLGKRSDLWYNLKNPAPEYKRFHEPMLWIADLAKHVIDYLCDHDKVCLASFRSHFCEWLRGIHESDVEFQSWQEQYGDTDFRRAVAAHSAFLSYQALQLDQKYGSHPLWGEIERSHLVAVPQQPAVISKTVVTPFVFECFKHLPWARFLEPQSPAPDVLRARKQQQRAFKPPTLPGNWAKSESQRGCSSKQRDGDKIISVGDVIAVAPDKVTQWKTNDDLWYAYVQSITERKKGQALGVLWLYRPSDTACQRMRYPFEKELFLSDHCNCGDGSFYASEAVHKAHVAFFAGPDNLKADFFVRQKYVEAEQSWMTLRESDFQCRCKEPTKSSKYEIGQTLLISKALNASQDILEPVELVENSPEGQANAVRVRRLSRRGRDYEQDADPNELVYTDVLEIVKAVRVHRCCHVRFFTEEDRKQRRIPSQYLRQGTADFYYIIYQDLQGSDGLTPLPKPWPSMKQGWDPTAASSPSQPLMRGLDVFCGGGNLGRGLEEGGAVKFEWAVDYFTEAIHTYRANLKNPDDTRLFNGSVNDYLSKAMQGTENKLIASAGSVEVISAGSPCQGFSNANLLRMNDEGLRNVSMVASVVSLVEFYRPKYALLENVPAMARCGAKDGNKNVFAQVLCALVGIGYQVRAFTLDAWNFGSPQSRTRLFVSIAAPGLTPLPDPPHSHSHPENICSRSLGKSANGLLISSRYQDLTPFEYVTIGEATKDLPLNDDGRGESIAFPDHHTHRYESVLNRVRISCIPRFPAGLNFPKAVRMGWMPPPQTESFNWNSKMRANVDRSRSWQRANPNALLATVMTSCVAEDGICGAFVHWDACRCLTIMEVRRAQGFPDEEVLMGQPSKQWKIVGNSVARQVALALGMSLRTAWLSNLENAVSSISETSSEASITPDSSVKRRILHRPIRPQSLSPCTKHLRHAVSSASKTSSKASNTPDFTIKPRIPHRPIGPQSLSQSAKRLGSSAVSSISPSPRPSLGLTPTSNSTMLPYSDLDISPNATTRTSMSAGQGMTALASLFSSEDEEEAWDVMTDTAAEPVGNVLENRAANGKWVGRLGLTEEEEDDYADDL